MMLRRIFSGSFAALLLAVSPLAAACDLSCAFALMNSDCHSQKTEIQNPVMGGMKMDGMAMDGMTMPEMSPSEAQQEVSAIPRTNARHPSIGDMGPCERQACDNNSAVSARTSRLIDPHFHSILAFVESPRAGGAQTLLRGAHEDIAIYYFLEERPLFVSLRI